jgi:hypothetical protein
MKGTMMAPTLYCLDIMLLTLGALIGASHHFPLLLPPALILARSNLFTLLLQHMFPQLQVCSGLASARPQLTSDRKGRGG